MTYTLPKKKFNNFFLILKINIDISKSLFVKIL